MLYLPALNQSNCRFTDRTHSAEVQRLILKTYPNAQTIRESKFVMNGIDGYRL